MKTITMPYEEYEAMKLELQVAKNIADEYMKRKDAFLESNSEECMAALKSWLGLKVGRQVKVTKEYGYWCLMCEADASGFVIS